MVAKWLKPRDFRRFSECGNAMPFPLAATPRWVLHAIPGIVPGAAFPRRLAVGDSPWRAGHRFRDGASGCVSRERTAVILLRGNEGGTFGPHLSAGSRDTSSTRKPPPEGWRRCVLSQDRASGDLDQQNLVEQIDGERPAAGHAPSDRLTGTNNAPGQDHCGQRRPRPRLGVWIRKPWWGSAIEMAHAAVAMGGGSPRRRLWSVPVATAAAMPGIARIRRDRSAGTRHVRMVQAASAPLVKQNGRNQQQVAKWEHGHHPGWLNSMPAVAQAEEQFEG